jgi:hypothetical protein
MEAAGPAGNLYAKEVIFEYLNAATAKLEPDGSTLVLLQVCF